MIKVPLPDHEEGTIFNPEMEGSKYTLFSGTEVLEARSQDSVLHFFKSHDMTGTSLGHQDWVSHDQRSISSLHSISKANKVQILF